MTNNLPPELEAFVAAKMATGRYATPEDVVVACVRNVYNREKEQAELDRLLQEGLDDLDAGRFMTLKNSEEIDRFFDRKLQLLRERHSSQQSTP